MSQQGWGTTRGSVHAMLVHVVLGLLVLGMPSGALGNIGPAAGVTALENVTDVDGASKAADLVQLAQAGGSDTPNYDIEGAFGSIGSGGSNAAAQPFTPTSDEKKLCKLKKAWDAAEEISMEHMRRMQQGLASGNEYWVKVSNDAARAKQAWHDHYFAIGYNNIDWARKDQYDDWCRGLSSASAAGTAVPQGPENITLRITAKGYEPREITYTAPQPITALNIDGRLIDPAGNPVQGASVKLLDSSFSEISRPDGRFNISAAGKETGAPFGVSGDITLTPEIPFAIRILDLDKSGKPYTGISADGVTSLTIELTGPPSAAPDKLSIACSPGIEPQKIRDRTPACSRLTDVNGSLQFTLVPRENNPQPYDIDIAVAVSRDDGSTDTVKLGKVPVSNAPVVLIHGIWSSRAAMIPLALVLDRTGSFDNVKSADYSATSFGDIRSNVAALPKAIDVALRRMEDSGIKGSKVDVVAHSQGGLIARLYILGYTGADGSPVAGHPGVIRKLITLGTPHLGSPLGDWYVKLDPPGMFECSGPLDQLSWAGSHEPYRQEFLDLLKFIREEKQLRDDALTYGEGVRQLAVHNNPVLEELNRTQRGAGNAGTDYYLVAGAKAFLTETEGNYATAFAPGPVYNTIYDIEVPRQCGQREMPSSFETMVGEFVAFATQPRSDGVVSVNSALASTTGIQPKYTTSVPYNHFNITESALVWFGVYAMLTDSPPEKAGTFIFKGSPGVLTVTDTRGRRLGPGENGIPDATYEIFETVTGSHTLVYIPETGTYSIRVDADDAGLVSLDVSQGGAGNWHWARYDDIAVEKGGQIVLDYAAGAPSAQVIDAGGKSTVLAPQANEMLSFTPSATQSGNGSSAAGTQVPGASSGQITTGPSTSTSGSGAAATGQTKPPAVSGGGAPGVSTGPMSGLANGLKAGAGPFELVSDGGWKTAAADPGSDAWMYPGYDDAAWQDAVADWPKRPAPASAIRGMEDTRAGWIWHDGDPDLVYFRRVIDMASQPHQAMLRITADNTYEVFVNGVPVGSDSGNQTSVWDTAESYDIAPLLRPAKNVIAVISRDMGGGSGLLLDIRFGGPDTVPDSQAGQAPNSGVVQTSPGSVQSPQPPQTVQAPAPPPLLSGAEWLQLGKQAFDTAWSAATDAGREAMLAQAFAHFEKAQELGNAEAIYRIGFMYETGNAVAQDNDIAIAHYEAAAQSGYADAYRQWMLVLHQLGRHDEAALAFFRYHKAFPQDAMAGFDDYAYGPGVLRAIQRELRKAGYYRGAIDGVIGPGTRAAIPLYVADQVPDELIHSDGGGWENGPASSSTAVATGGYYMPARGSAERKAIMDAARVPIAAELGRPFIFVVDELRTDGRWVYLQAVPHNPDSSPFDWSTTRYAEAWRGDFMSDVVMVLLENAGGRFRVVDYVIGPTDVHWYGWIDGYGLPEPLFNPG